jgi:hypothetical protein
VIGFCAALVAIGSLVVAYRLADAQHASAIKRLHDQQIVPDPPRPKRDAMSSAELYVHKENR